MHLPFDSVMHDGYVTLTLLRSANSASRSSNLHTHTQIPLPLPAPVVLELLGCFPSRSIPASGFVSAAASHTAAAVVACCVSGYVQTSRYRGGLAGDGGKKEERKKKRGKKKREYASTQHTAHFPSWGGGAPVCWSALPTEKRMYVDDCLRSGQPSLPRADADIERTWGCGRAGGRGGGGLSKRRHMRNDATAAGASVPLAAHSAGNSTSSSG